MTLLLLSTLLLLMPSCSNNHSITEEETVVDWSNYDVGEIHFIDKAPESVGSKVYHQIIPDPVAYIEEQARVVLSTLYFSPQDSIVPVEKIIYTLEDREGISAKSGGEGTVTIFYSTQYIEKIYNEEPNYKERLLFETRGVLLHELTHAYQLEPQGIGTYGTNKTFWALIEGIADGVRVVNGGFRGAQDRPTGGHYTQGYRYAGYFYAWLQEEKDPDFIKKLNQSTLQLNPWSFKEAFQLILGPNADPDLLWEEYQASITSNPQ